MPSDQAALNRVRWQCRRGMLELDLLLQGFVEAHWTALDSARRDDLERLLREPDNLLLEWFHRGATPLDPRLRGLVEQILAGDV